MNNATVYGRLGQDATLSTTQNGTSMLKFSVANNTGYKDEKKTNWFRCVLWGKRGESLQQYMKKGTAVIVSGEVTLNTWTGKDDGVEKSELALNVKELTLAGSKSESGGGEEKSSSPPAKAAAAKAPAGGGAISFDDDDLPF